MSWAKVWFFGGLALVLFVGILGALVPSPVEQLRGDVVALRDSTSTLIDVADETLKWVEHLEARIASLEATRPNTQTEQKP